MKFANHESAHLADPICTLIFLIIILFTTIRVVLDIIKILMGHVDSHDYDRIVKILEDHVDGTHSLHIWQGIIIVCDKSFVDLVSTLLPIIGISHR